MNYTLKQLQERVNKLIEVQGEDAPCSAWIYTAEDCYLTDDDGEQEYVALDNRELAENIFYQVGDCDYIYTAIQDAVEEATEEQYMLSQQELMETK
jgi:hypothetical protein